MGFTEQTSFTSGFPESQETQPTLRDTLLSATSRTLHDRSAFLDAVYGAGADSADPGGVTPGALKREAGTQTGAPTCLERFNVLTHWLGSSTPLILTRSPGAPPQTLGTLFPSPPPPQHHLPKPLLSSLRALGMSPVRTTPAHYLRPPVPCLGLLDSLGPQSDEEAEEIPVCSLLLAAKSCVLRTMLSNGMRESDRGASAMFKVTREGQCFWSKDIW
jgi:hypothetical protein